MKNCKTGKINFNYRYEIFLFIKKNQGKTSNFASPSILQFFFCTFETPSLRAMQRESSSWHLHLTNTQSTLTQPVSSFLDIFQSIGVFLQSGYKQRKSCLVGKRVVKLSGHSSISPPLTLIFAQKKIFFEPKKKKKKKLPKILLLSIHLFV